MNFLKSNQEKLFDHNCRALITLSKSETLRYKESSQLAESLINALCVFHANNKWCGSDLAKTFITASENIVKGKETFFVEVADLVKRLEKEINNLLVN